MRLLGVVAAGDDSQNVQDDLNDAIPYLNQQLDSTNIRYAQIYSITQRQFPLTASTAQYTIGLGGVFNTPRPIKIESAGQIQGNGLKMMLDMNTSMQWASIPDKSMAAKQCLVLYNDNAYPLANLNVWPAPSNNTSQLEIFCWEEFPNVVALTDVITLPPGYEKFLKYSLAVALAPTYGLIPDAIAGVIQQAQAAAQELLILNTTDSAASLAPVPPAQGPQG